MAGPGIVKRMLTTGRCSQPLVPHFAVPAVPPFLSHPLLRSQRLSIIPQHFFGRGLDRSRTCYGAPLGEHRQRAADACAGVTTTETKGTGGTVYTGARGGCAAPS
eukprot:gene22334-biopygen5736